MPTESGEHFSVSQDRLPGVLGVEVVSVSAGSVRSRLKVAPLHLGPNGYLHAGTIIVLADTCCGYGCGASLPKDGIGFTTIELKANFLGTLREGTLACEATLAHSGRTTQVWDATITDEASGKKLAIFRCTQLVLYPTAARK